VRKLTEGIMTEAMLPGERADFSGIADRKPLKLPDGGRMILWPVLALEVWDISRPMARTVIPPPQGEPLLPDVPNWSWHEYGMRVGFWRLKSMLKELGVRPTVTLNARVCEDYPQVAQACLEQGWEFNAHSYEQIPMHKLPDQAAVIKRSLDVIGDFCGRTPRGWFGPGLTQTYDTLDYLAAAGIEYIGDWAFDDQPIPLRTTHSEVIALPYNFEIHDIVMMAIQHHGSEVYRTRALDYFDTLYAESEHTTRIMALAMHPYLSGSPHRIRYVRETLQHILAQPGVVCWDGEQILDWYKKARPTAL
jgi:allantoinase